MCIRDSGTVELLEEKERRRIKGLVINKFRGDVEILRPGLSMLEEKTHLVKADFILSLCELIVGGKEGLQPVEKTVIDRCVHQIYHLSIQYSPSP